MKDTKGTWVHDCFFLFLKVHEPSFWVNAVNSPIGWILTYKLELSRKLDLSLILFKTELHLSFFYMYASAVVVCLFYNLFPHIFCIDAFIFLYFCYIKKNWLSKVDSGTLGTCWAMSNSKLHHRSLFVDLNKHPCQSPFCCKQLMVYTSLWADISL